MAEISPEPWPIPATCLECRRPISIPSCAPGKRFCGALEGDPSGKHRNAWWSRRQAELAAARHRERAAVNAERESSR